MNQRHLWTIVALSVTVLGTPAVGRTQTTKATAPAEQILASDVVKVGEFQSSEGKRTSDAVITSIHPHNLGGRRAATLFIRKIPVLTFVSSNPVASVETKVGAIGDTKGVQSYALNTEKSVQVASLGNLADARIQNRSQNDDPVKRASSVAAKINQLIRNNVKADQITVSWKGADSSLVASQSQNKSSSSQQKLERYTIKVNNQELVEINQNTRLADSTNNLANDALQATNRLRRLLGNASPLKEIANLPARSPKRSSNPIANLPQRIASGIRLTFQGIASFYGHGDGFAGRPTATGERFNPEAMTAAHRSLPFGTRVRVTNTRNGRSVVVRINDRGPFSRGRVIDLSTGAARVIGMIGSGVAPVRIEVLGR
ncbi:septal ring lytic transglycosylase RlpA family protein [Nostoc parmelioides]|uniref:Probable endolytic peptidoglycan transglycosylase RlpA n=1 Tax=Nostoc parmelioides FACHB-3921 TaxID=2692909 RepID=A0ABR8BCP9_9NOSO|nr:septal ring lytic transglycosylase RlpA family protein [Nostoc parmelioides]MBD2251499.1 septal ring lytic transglycosylase RlpA family protein [Nostoc parmelioides FACHB-3921]